MTTPSATVRLGVLTDGDDVPYWLASALRELQERGLADVVLVVQRVSATPGVPQGTRIGRWWKNRQLLAFALAERLDRRRAPASPAAESLRTIAPTASRLDVSPILGRFTDTFSDDDVAAVRRHDLDVLVRVGFRILKGSILDAARHGVWSFHHGDNRTNRGGPPGVWEVLEDRQETGVTLQRLSSELDGGEVLARGVGRTERFSFSRNVASLYPRSSRMLVRSVERLARGQPARQACADDGEWNAYQHRL
jgi:folate-dependent phosphoribosylglycinamide formyltransferase PurN